MNIYESKHLLCRAQITKLFSIPTITFEYAAALSELYETVTSILPSLKCLGIDVEGLDALVLYFLYEKLPPFNVKLWDGSRPNNKQLPKWSQLVVFIYNRICVLETLGTRKEANLLDALQHLQEGVTVCKLAWLH